MQKASLVLIPLIIVLIAFYFFVFSWAIPKSALLSLPVKWRLLPVQQSNQVAHAYLGNFYQRDSIKNNVSETWLQGTKGKMYVLKLWYGMDTIVTGYSIHYQFKNVMANRDYLLDSFSLR
jgi:hypothetical protein